MTALPSHTPRSSGCASPHGQWQRRQSPASAERPASIAARTAGSSLSSASVVAAVTRWAHSPSAAAAASRAAANCRAGSSPSPAMAASSHPAPVVASAPAARPAAMRLPGHVGPGIAGRRVEEPRDAQQGQRRGSSESVSARGTVNPGQWPFSPAAMTVVHEADCPVGPPRTRRRRAAWRSRPQAQARSCCHGARAACWIAGW
jgi:hypothetical protein